MSIAQQLPVYYRNQIAKKQPARAASVLMAKAADCVFPGRVVANSDSRGAFLVSGSVPSVGAMYDAEVAVVSYLESLGLMLKLPALKGDGTIDPQYPPSWALVDFDDTLLKPFVNDYYLNAQQSIAGVMQSKVLPMFSPLMPADMQSAITALMDCGFIVFPNPYSEFSSPAWLAVSEYKQAWQAVAKQCSQISVLADRKNFAQLVQEGQVLADNAQFWDNTTRIVAAIATMGATEVLKMVNTDLKRELKKFKASKEKALALAATADYTQAAKIRQTVQDEETKIRQRLTPLFPLLSGLENELKNDGLGAISIAAGVSAVVVASVAILAIKAVIESWTILDGIGNAIQKPLEWVGPIMGLGAAVIGMMFLYKYANKKASKA